MARLFCKSAFYAKRWERKSTSRSRFSVAIVSPNDVISNARQQETDLNQLFAKTDHKAHPKFVHHNVAGGLLKRS
ncbi:MAG: hypothetical protein IPI44_24730 [Sulfuritalea sp.]|nr:hypothetical protein [Sulfuritalea sp.]